MENLSVYFILLIVLLVASILMAWIKNKGLKKQIKFFSVLYQEDFMYRRSSDMTKFNKELFSIVNKLKLKEIELFGFHFVYYYKTFAHTAFIVKQNIDAINGNINDKDKISRLLRFLSIALEKLNEKQLASFYVSTFEDKDGNEFSSTFFERERRLIDQLIKDKSKSVFADEVFEQISKLVEEKKDESDKILLKAEAVRIKRMY